MLPFFAFHFHFFYQKYLPLPQRYGKLLKLLLLTALIVALCVALLSVKLLLKKGGRFPSPHVGDSQAMRERGIGCVQSQDYEQRHKRKRIK